VNGDVNREDESNPSGCHKEHGEDDVDRQLREVGVILLSKLRGMDAKDVALILTSVALVIVSIFQAVGTVQSASAAKDAAETARKALNASNRPWLDLTPTIMSGWTINAQGEGRIVIQVDASNIGHSPAVRSVSTQTTFQAILLTPNPWEELKKTCDAASGQSANPRNRGITYTVFPGKPLTEVINEGWSQQELSKSITTLFPEAHAGPDIHPVIAWCVAYRSDFDPNTTHRTGYVWELQRRTPGGLKDIDRNANVPAGEVVLQGIWPLGQLAD
jgi:hypothetical protein